LAERNAAVRLDFFAAAADVKTRLDFASTRADAM